MFRAVPFLALLLQVAVAVQPEAAVNASQEAAPAAPPAQQEGLGQSEVDLAKKVESEFWQHAERAIGGLHALEGELKGGLANTSNVAQSIVDKAKADFHDRRDEAERELDARMKTLDHLARAPANASEEAVGSALRDARGAAKVLTRVTRQEFRAMRRDLRQRYKADKARARALFKEAREATKQARKFGRSFAKALKKAGAGGAASQRAGVEAELSAEQLQLQAELAAEHAEDLAEERFEALEAKLHNQMEQLQDVAASESMAHEDRLQQAKAALEKARRQEHEEERAEKTEEEAEQHSNRTQTAAKPQQITALRAEGLAKPARTGLPVTVLYVAMVAALAAMIGILVSRPLPAPVMGLPALG